MQERLHLALLSINFCIKQFTKLIILSPRKESLVLKIVVFKQEIEGFCKLLGKNLCRKFIGPLYLLVLWYNIWLQKALWVCNVDVCDHVMSMSVTT